MGLIDMLVKRKKQTEEAANVDLENPNPPAITDEMNKRNIGTLKGLKEVLKKKEKEEKGE